MKQIKLENSQGNCPTQKKRRKWYTYARVVDLIVEVKDASDASACLVQSQVKLVAVFWDVELFALKRGTKIN